MQGGHELDCRPKKCFNNVLTKNVKGITSCTTSNIQIDITISIIMGFNQLKKKYLNCLFIIYKLNIVKLETSTQNVLLFLFPLLNIWHD